MKIETKFNVGQTVFVISYNEIKSFTVYKIVSTSHEGRTSHSYTTNPYDRQNIKTSYFENSVYGSKEEAAKAWLEQQGLAIGEIEC